MLNVLFMLNCDKCHAPLSRAAATNEQDGELRAITWEEAADVLLCWAAEDGWGIYKHAHICFACLTDNQALFTSHCYGSNF